MFRDASNEIRLHPGRFVATLLAIAISVAFIAAISTLVSTEQQSMARFTQLPVSKADVVVEGDFDDASTVMEALRGVEGVTAVASASSVVGVTGYMGAPRRQPTLAGQGCCAPTVIPPRSCRRPGTWCPRPSPAARSRSAPATMPARQRSTT